MAVTDPTAEKFCSIIRKPLMRKKDRGKGTDAVPKVVDRESSERLALDILEHVRDAGAMPDIVGSEPQQPRRVTAEQLLATIISRSNGAKPGRKLLGMSAGDVAKFLIVIASAVGTVYVGMQAAIEDNSDAVEDIGEDLAHHADEPLHHGAKVELDGFDKRLGTIERTTDRIEIQQSTIVEGIGEIKVELREQRRRRRP